jgi:1-acyl-sn-glycerol-3-phosphate acyltransferase
MLIFLFTRHSFQGKENMPRNGPLLVVSNHLSVSDPVLLGVGLSRRITFMAKEELFRNWFTSYFVHSFGAFPVYRGRTNRDALRQADQVLRQGKVLAMFPEGKRSRVGSMQVALPGSALIAWHNKATILPIGITGTEKIKGLGWIWSRPKISFVVGQPFELPDYGKALKKEQLNEYTDIIMYHIAELLPKKYQGQYTIRED